MNKFKFDQLFHNKKSAKIISVLLAIITWFVIIIFFSQDTHIEIRDIPVNVDMDGTHAKTLGLSVVEGADEPISVTISGRRSVIGGLTWNDFTATVSAASVTGPGEYTLDCYVALNKPNNEIDIITNNIIPMLLKFDKKEAKKYTIIPIADNITAADGFIKIDPYCTPTEITVEGTQSDIERLDKVIVSSEVRTRANESLQLDGELKFYDENDIELKSELYTPETTSFTISVVIYQVKSVPVTVEFLHLPDGVNKNEIDYTLSHTEIEIAASVDTIKNINSIIAGNIDLREVDKGNSEFTFEVGLPSGAIIVSGIDKVTVKVNTDKLRTKTFTVRTLRIINAPPDYSVVVSREELTGVKVIGKSDIVRKLTSKDIIGIIDLMGTNIVQGDSTVPITVEIPNKGLVWAVGEYSTPIKINAE